MKTEDLNRIKNLLNKYDMGQTSLEEEAFLMKYFSSGNVLNEFASYKAEFNYYAFFKNIPTPGTIKTSEISFFQKIVQLFSKWYVIFALVLVPASMVILNLQDRQTENETTMLLQEVTKPSPLELSDSTQKNTTDPQFKKNSVNETSKNTVENPVTLSPTKDSKEISRMETDTIATLDGPPPNFNSSTNIIDPKPGNEVPQIIPKPSKQGNLEEPTQKGETPTFNLTEDTSTGELARIARLAEKAGIEYTYVVDQHKKQIHELNIIMIIRETGERSQLWITVPKKGNFSEELGWKVDENGRAKSLSVTKIDHQVKAKHPLEK